MKRSRLIALVLVTLAFATVGCGGKKPAARSSPTLSLEEADRLLAEKLVLQQADLPSWPATPHVDDPREDDFGKQLAACVGAPPPDTSTSAEVDGPDFSMGDAEVSSSASFDRTLELAQQDLAALKSAELPECVKSFAVQELRAALAEQTPGASLSSVSFDPRTVAHFGDATVGFRLVATIKVQGQTIKAYQDLVFLVKGRAGVAAAFSNVGRPFDEALETLLIDKLGVRLIGTVV